MAAAGVRDVSGIRASWCSRASCFVLHTGIAWEHPPQELGFGSGMTCWRRLAEWTEAGEWSRPHEALLAELRGANALDSSRAAVDGSHIRALKGEPGPDEVPFRGRSEAGAGVLRVQHLVAPYGRGRAAVGRAGQAHATQIQTEACPGAGLLARLQHAVHVSAAVQ